MEVRRYADAGVRVIVGEWSLGTCGMFGNHPKTLTDADFLYSLYASTKAVFVQEGAEGDYFWSGVVRTGGYDPTLYTSHGRGARNEILDELSAASSSPEWCAPHF